MTRVLLVDDQPLVREIVREILRDAPEIEVVGEAGDGDEMMALLSKQACDLVLLDISLPGRSGIELLKVLRRNLPAMAVVMLSTHAEEDYLTRSMKEGASAYVQKRHAADRLVPVIRNVVGSQAACG
jgi:DNA-binding NarL/FixJ family response regulator